MQTIFYNPPKKNFTITPNKLIQDENLSNNAKLVAMLILSLPKNFKINSAFLMNKLKISQRTLQRAFKELIDEKYMIKSQAKDENGHFNKFNIFVFIDEESEILAESLSELEEENLNEALKTQEISKQKIENLSISLSENSQEKENRQEQKQDTLKAEKTGILKEKHLKIGGWNELKENKSPKNETSRRCAKKPLAEICRPYKEINIDTNKENLYTLSFLKRNLLIFFKKANLSKKSVDLSFFNEDEKKSIGRFFEYRKEKAKGKGLSLSTRLLIAKKCEDFKKQGHNISQIIEKSIMSGWIGLFEPKNADFKAKKQDFKNLSPRALSQEIISQCLKLNPSFEVFNKEAVKGLKIQGKAVIYDEKTYLYKLEA